VNTLAVVVMAWPPAERRRTTAWRQEVRRSSDPRCLDLHRVEVRDLALGRREPRLAPPELVTNLLEALIEEPTRGTVHLGDRLHEAFALGRERRDLGRQLLSLGEEVLPPGSGAVLHARRDVGCERAIGGRFLQALEDEGLDGARGDDAHASFPSLSRVTHL
jgi:hypothetical protein